MVLLHQYILKFGQFLKDLYRSLYEEKHISIKRIYSHLSPRWGLYLRLANVLYTFRPAGADTLMSDIFSLSYNTVRNTHKMNFIIHFGSTSGATGV